MRSIFWPIFLLLILWLLVTVLLPAWIPVQFVPNLLLAGILLLAITDTNFQWFWLAAAAGFVLDVQSHLLFGSYFIAFCVAYAGVRLVFKRFVPSHHIYFMLPIIYFIVAILCRVWLALFGFLARGIGWHIQPLFSFSQSIAFLISTGIGSVIILVLYLIWLEVLHRFDRPLRLRR